jgi:hypothetical protein
MLYSPPVMGSYNTPFQAAWLGMRDLVHGPCSEQNHPTPTELMQHDRQDVGGCSMADSAPALGSRSTGLGGMVQ